MKMISDLVDLRNPQRQTPSPVKKTVIMYRWNRNNVVL
jgi:hypothetical protein